MAFINEEISAEDKRKINLEKIKNIAGISKASELWLWTIDRERDVFLLYLLGGDTKRPACYALILKDEIVTFNANLKGDGNRKTGVKVFWKVFNLRISQTLEVQREEIKQLICEALDTYGFGKRDSVIDVNVEFE